MEWLNLSATVPGSVDVMAGWGAALVALLSACVPAWLAARDALRRRPAAAVPRLRVLPGTSPLHRRAA